MPDNGAAIAAAARTQIVRKIQADQLQANSPDNFVSWAARAGVRQVVTPYVPIGPLRDWLREAEAALARRDIVVCKWQRGWDKAIWPHASSGFFKVKDKIPVILQELELT